MITKKHAWYFILTVVIIALIVVFFRIKNTTGEQEQVLNEVLKFSNTQEWDTELYGIIDDEPLILKNSFEKIKLPTPPSNDSKETEEELMVLHSMVSERTGEKVEQIKERWRS